MADERIFKVKIDGLEKSYKDTVKLLDALTSIKDVHAKVAVETEAMSKATVDSANKTKERIKVLTDEEKALKKLKDTQDKARKPITELEKAQEKANRQLKERSKLLQQQVTEETAAQNSIAQMKAELKKLNDEWNNVDMNSDRFKELTDEIDKLTNKLKEAEAAKGTFTRNVGNYPQQINSINESFKKLGDGINNTANNTKGMLNLFQAGVGIALMFDDKNSDLAKTLNSLGKIMAIIGALQQANNLLLTKGAIASKGAAVMESVHTLQIKARATAISLATKNTLAASIAQKAFNLVAAANPYVLLAMALVSVIGALVLFSGNTETAAEKQKVLNDLESESIELKKQVSDRIKSNGDQRVKELEREYELMKAKGASEAQLALKNKQINDERVKNALEFYDKNRIEADSIEDNIKKSDKYLKSLNEINKALKDKKGVFKVEIDGESLKLDTNNKKQLEETRTYIQDRLSNINAKINVGIEAKNAYHDARTKADKDEANARKSAMEAGKRSNIAMAEYRVLIAKKSSAEELEANKEAIKLRLKAELSSANITKGERVKRTEEALQQISKLEEDFRNSQLQDEINLIDARLSLLEKGTEEEFTLRSELLEKQQQKELDNANLTELQKDAIRLKYESKFIKLEKEKAKYLSENEINTTISSINARLACVKKGTEEELNLRLELAQANAQIAREDAVNNIANEELKIAKLKEINAQWQKEKRELSVDAEVSNVEAQAKKETLSLIQELEKRTISKRAYEDKMLALSIESLQKEIAIRKKYGQDTTDLETDLSELRIDQSDREKDKITRHFEEMNAKLQEIAGNVMEGVTSIFSAVNSVYQAQLDDANEKYDEISKKYDEVVAKREESLARIEDLEKQAHDARGGRFLALQDQIFQEMQTNAELAGQEKQLAKDKEKQEKEIAKKEKQRKKLELAQNIIQGLVNIAVGVTKAWSLGPLVGPAMATLVSAAGAIQVGIMTKQLSKLEDGGLLKGKRHTEGGMRVEGTNIEVEGGEYVINRISTNKNLGLIKYINSQRRELKPSDLSSFFSKATQNFDPPFKRMFETGGILPPVENTINIDNESLIEAIQSIKIEPKVAVTDINNAQENLVTVDNWTGL